MLVATQVGLLGMLSLLLLVASLGDIRAYRIPNKLNLTIAALALPYWLVRAEVDSVALWPTLWPQLLLIAATFGLIALFLALNLFGGGDAKLLLALSFWFTLDQYLMLLTVMAAAGGLLCLAVLLMRNRNEIVPSVDMEGMPTQRRRKQRIPYGVAIAAGALVPASELILNALLG